MQPMSVRFFHRITQSKRWDYIKELPNDKLLNIFTMPVEFNYFCFFVDYKTILLSSVFISKSSG